MRMLRSEDWIDDLKKTMTCQSIIVFEIPARNVQFLPEMLIISKSDRFCGISWYRWISIVFQILLETVRNRQELSEIWRHGRFP